MTEQAVTLGALIERAHNNARAKGFWDSPRPVGTLIALVRSEYGEALEAHRKWLRYHEASDQAQAAPWWANLGEELGDGCIRVFDMLGGLRLTEHLRGFDEYRIVDLRPQHPPDWWAGAEFGTKLEMVHKKLGQAFSASIVPDSPSLLAIHLVLMYTSQVAAEMGIDLEAAIRIKMAVNEGRPRLHGKAY